MATDCKLLSKKQIGHSTVKEELGRKNSVAPGIPTETTEDLPSTHSSHKPWARTWVAEGEKQKQA